MAEDEPQSEQVMDSDLSLGDAPASEVRESARRYRRRTALAVGAGAVAVIAGAIAFAQVVGRRHASNLYQAQADALSAWVDALSASEDAEHLQAALERRAVRNAADIEGVSHPETDALDVACGKLRKASHELAVSQLPIHGCDPLVRKLPGCEEAYAFLDASTSREDVEDLLSQLRACIDAVSEKTGEPLALQLEGDLPALPEGIPLPKLPSGYDYTGERPQLFVKPDGAHLIETLWKPDCEEGKNHLGCRTWAVHALVNGAWDEKTVALSPMLDATGEPVTFDDIVPMGEWGRTRISDRRSMGARDLNFEQGVLLLTHEGPHLVATTKPKGSEALTHRRLAVTDDICAARYAHKGGVGVVCVAQDMAESRMFISHDGGQTWK